MWPHSNRSKPVIQYDATAYGKIRDRLDTALTSVFSEEGKRAVLYHMTKKYKLTLEQASVDPCKFEAAMTNLLGEVGWIVVKRKILEQFPGQILGEDDYGKVEKASLREAFSVIMTFPARFQLGSPAF